MPRRACWRARLLALTPTEAAFAGPMAARMTRTHSASHTMGLFELRVDSPCLSIVAAAAIAPLRPWEALAFDTDRWCGLREAVARQLFCEPHEIGRLHEIDAARGLTLRKNRRRTTGARCDVPALESLIAVYETFICEVVAPHVAHAYLGECDSLVFQAMPSLRVATPSDKAAGQRHRDGGYGHQPGQINFWLPLAPAYGSNTLWLELGDASTAGTSAPVPLEGDFGALHRFHGHELFHFTLPNDTPATRVSLDFRVIPGPCYDDDWPGSRAAGTGRQQFFVGGYYSRAALDRTADASGSGWCVCREDSESALRGNAAKLRRRMLALGDAA